MHWHTDLLFRGASDWEWHVHRITKTLAAAVVAFGLAAASVPAARAVGPEAAPASRPSIMGGQSIDITRVPWQVLIEVNRGESVCGGSLVTPIWIVTAAHCFDKGANTPIRVFTGVENLSRITAKAQQDVAQLLIYPGWDAKNFNNDIALIKLAKPVAFSKSVRTIALPVSQDVAAWPAVGSTLQVSGWGATREGGDPSTTLRAANVSVLVPADGECGSYGGSYKKGLEICAGAPGGGVDACQGDSGGPLRQDVNGLPVLAGVVSVGNGCGRPDFPGLYTRTAGYLSWLRQNFEVPSVAPVAPSNVQAVGGKGSATVSWTTNGKGAWTQVKATPGGATCLTVGDSCVVKGLKKGKTYAFSVSSTNPAGPGPAAFPAPKAQVQ